MCRFKSVGGLLKIVGLTEGPALLRVLSPLQCSRGTPVITIEDGFFCNCCVNGTMRKS